MTKNSKIPAPDGTRLDTLLEHYSLFPREAGARQLATGRHRRVAATSEMQSEVQSEHESGTTYFRAGCRRAALAEELVPQVV